MSDVNFFRTRRGRVLRQQIDLLAAHLGRPITVLDLGGRPGYWGNIGMDNIASVHVLNNERTELAGSSADRRFSFEVGDACDLSAFTDKSVDLVHSNLVIEHVGLWPDQHAMAEEAIRVGLSGWIQTPAFEFRIEPHHGLPFTHWLGQPIRRALLRACAGLPAHQCRRQAHARRQDQHAVARRDADAVPRLQPLRRALRPDAEELCRPLDA